MLLVVVVVVTSREGYHHQHCRSKNRSKNIINLMFVFHKW